MVWVVEDATEQKRLERLRNDLDQIMRHDLKNPLFNIGNLRQAVESEGPLNERQKDLCAMIGDAAAEAIEQINISLLLYKIESERLVPVYESLDLSEILDGVTQALSPYCNQENARKEIALTGDWDQSPQVMGDRLMLQTALTNLVKNALEAMPGESVMEASCRVAKDAVILTLTNPGEIPPQIRDRFFEKYATHGKPRGTGLGTYSARLIARAMGGDVELSPCPPGYAAVTLRLRRSQAGRPADHAEIT